MVFSVRSRLKELKKRFCQTFKHLYPVDSNSVISNTSLFPTQSSCICPSVIYYRLLRNVMYTLFYKNVEAAINQRTYQEHSSGLESIKGPYYNSYYSCICHYKVSKKEMYQLALNSLKKIKERKINF